MSDQHALEFENVSKQFASGRVVVAGLSLMVRPGEFFSILGPSGCGKTTCLRMISGLEKPSSGIIRMQGRTVNDVHPHKRNVHTVFQKYALFPHLNVFENVAFGLRMRKRSEPEIRDRVAKMLQMVRLGDYGKRPIQQLSGGEQQRVALVRALINEPAILLLDEPLAALDLKLREQMQLELASLQRQLGTTFIFVTHDQGEALTLSDRVAIMNDGRLEQVGTPTEVYERPATEFVARFVGTTNAFQGSICRSDTDGTISVRNPFLEPLHARVENASPRFGLEQNVSLLVRPEKVRVRVTPPQDASSSSGLLNVLKGTLVEQIYFGATTQIKLQINDNLPPLIALIANQSSSKRIALRVGEKYFAVWDAQDSVLVPRADELSGSTATSRVVSIGAEPVPSSTQRSALGLSSAKELP